MTALDTNKTVGELVATRPGRARVFEKLGIDYCCGGKKPLEQACQEKGLDAAAVLRALETTEAQEPCGVDWSQRPLTELADHIELTHHTYLNSELPRLTRLFEKVEAAHGAHHPEIAEMRETFSALRGELEAHLMKEEQILFPLIRQLERGAVGGFHCGSINNPISVMEHEHDQAGHALVRLRRLSGDYTVPPDGCATYGQLLEGLAHLEGDLHEHIHKENNILFLRASDLEARAYRPS